MSNSDYSGRFYSGNSDTNPSPFGDNARPSPFSDKILSIFKEYLLKNTKHFLVILLYFILRRISSHFKNASLKGEGKNASPKGEGRIHPNDTKFFVIQGVYNIRALIN